MGAVKPPLAALDVMESQRPLHPLPEVEILHRHQLAEEFPAPAVGLPLGQAVLHSVADVSAAPHQGDLGGLIQRFQGPNDGQQFEAFALQTGLSVGRLELLGAIGRTQDELPMADAPAPGEPGKTAGSGVLLCPSQLRVYRGNCGGIMVNLAKPGKPVNIFRRQYLRPAEKPAWASCRQTERSPYPFAYRQHLCRLCSLSRVTAVEECSTPGGGPW